MQKKYNKHDIRLAIVYINDPTFKPQHHHILLLIATLLNDEHTFFWGKGSLSSLCRWSKETVKRTIKELEQKKYLILLKKGGHQHKDTNIYTINIEHLMDNTTYVVGSHRPLRGVSQTPLVGSHRPACGVSQTPESVIDSKGTSPPLVGRLVPEAENQEKKLVDANLSKKHHRQKQDDELTDEDWAKMTDDEMKARIEEKFKKPNFKRIQNGNYTNRT